MPPPIGAHTTRGCKDGLIFVRKRMRPCVFQISPLTVRDACGLCGFRVDFHKRIWLTGFSLGMLLPWGPISWITRKLVRTNGYVDRRPAGRLALDMIGQVYPAAGKRWRKFKASAWRREAR